MSRCDTAGMDAWVSRYLWVHMIGTMLGILLSGYAFCSEARWWIIPLLGAGVWCVIFLMLAVMRRSAMMNADRTE